MVETTTRKKDPAAVRLGRKGALKRWANRPRCGECGRPLPLARKEER